MQVGSCHYIVKAILLKGKKESDRKRQNRSKRRLGRDRSTTERKEQRDLKYSWTGSQCL
jgi:hypothetical protein